MIDFFKKYLPQKVPCLFLSYDSMHCLMCETEGGRNSQIPHPPAAHSGQPRVVKCVAISLVYSVQ